MVRHAPRPSFKSGRILKIIGPTDVQSLDIPNLRVLDVGEGYRWLHVRSSKTHTHWKVPIPNGLWQYLRLWLEHGFRHA